MAHFPFTDNGEINGTFTPLTWVFSIDQCALTDVDRLHKLANK